MKLSPPEAISTWVLFLLLPVYSACGSIGLTGDQALSRDRNQSSPGPSSIQLEPINEKGVKKILGKNKGSVVVINFWATWCVPCREEFPDLVKLYANYRDKGIQLVLLSMDDQDQVEAVKKFLKDNSVDFVSYIRAGEDFEGLVNAIDPQWVGAIPSTFVFNRHGRRVDTMVGKQDYGAFEKAIRPLL
ncbi:MAG TPA: TlpA disulfide reductase family protein [Acidobacteriota bacterium]|jgi:thiol-disulfide isomerase/thioredoxin